jgi:DNA-binding beta-propeller fold protein YncE
VTLRRVGLTAVPPGPKPGFDHADTYVDPGGSRLYVAHTGADRVDVLDCVTGRYLRAIADLPGVAGVLIDSAQDLLFTSDRAAARVSIFRASDERLLGRVAVGPRPNALAYDPERRNLFSFDLGEPAGTSCTASVVSVDQRTL